MLAHLLQGRSFGCLPRLREMRIDVEVSSDGVHAFGGSVHIDMAGLPPKLQTLKVVVQLALLPASDSIKPEDSRKLAGGRRGALSRESRPVPQLHSAALSAGVSAWHETDAGRHAGARATSGSTAAHSLQCCAQGEDHSETCGKTIALTSHHHKPMVWIEALVRISVLTLVIFQYM